MSAGDREGGPVLVGYDGSEQGRDALALTRVLAPLAGGGVVALSVVTAVPIEIGDIDVDRMIGEEMRRHDAEVRAALSGVDGVEHRHVQAPSPAHQLHDAASEIGAAMIVLGSTHRGPIGRILPGSVAERLLSAAPCPIAVAPRGYRERGGDIRRVLVAYDGGPEADRALDVAAALAARAGADVRLIGVANPLDAQVPGSSAAGWTAMVLDEDRLEAERQRFAELLEAAAGRIRARGGDGAITGDVFVDTHPATVIADASEDADLLVMGSRGYGPLGRVLLGGIAANVIRNAACPVIVATRPDEE